mmetsp:Transcript_44741/g.65676  ORF Transcript_44741/g.65676 Transcript_44741/m.65676 type:complete len:250 (-) Transcript_44741:680-1429(-)
MLFVVFFTTLSVSGWRGDKSTWRRSEKLVLRKRATSDSTALRKCFPFSCSATDLERTFGTSSVWKVTTFIPSDMLLKKKCLTVALPLSLMAKGDSWCLFVATCRALQESHTSTAFHTCTFWIKNYLSRTTKKRLLERTTHPLALTMSKLPRPVFNDWLSFSRKHDVTTLASPLNTQITKKREEADEEAKEEEMEGEKELEEMEEEEGGRAQRVLESARWIRIASRKKLEMGVGLLVLKSQWPKRPANEK